MNVEKYGVTVTQKPDGREIFPYASNATASYIPNVFLGTGDKVLAEKYWPKGVEEKGVIKEPPNSVTKIALKKLTQKLEDDIRNAAEVRFQLFYNSLLLAWKKKFVFTKCFTEGQAGVKAKKSSDIESEIKLVEAHASTNPSLLYSTEAENVTSLLDCSTTETLIFDGANKNHHLTHKFPKYVNQVDLLIDENTKDQKFKFLNFRQRSIQILNECSKGTITVKEAFLGFLGSFVYIADKISEKEGCPNHHKLVLSFYKKTAECYIAKKDLPRFWKSLSFSHSNKEKQVSDLTLETIQEDQLCLVARNRVIHGKYQALRKLCDEYLKSENELTNTVHELDVIIMGVIVENIEPDPETEDFLTLKGECETINNPKVLAYERDCFLNKEVRMVMTTYLRDNDDVIQKKGGPTAIKWDKTQIAYKTTEFLREKYGKNVQSINAICLNILWDIQFYSRYKLDGEFCSVCQFFNLGPMEIYKLYDRTSSIGKYANQCIEDEDINTKARELIELLNS